MARKITPKQKKFAIKYLETGNGAQSALAVYDTKDLNVAGNIASENLRRPNVREYLESKAEIAASIVFSLAQSSEIDNVRLAASKDILDRAGYVSVSESRSTSLSINAKDLQDVVLKDMQRFQGPTKP